VSIRRRIPRDERISAVGVRYVVVVRILGICGSLQAHSTNLTLLQAAAASTSGPPGGVEFAIFDGLRDLPSFDSDVVEPDLPPTVRAWRNALAESDALLIASPEYGMSLPGALKNAIDWVIGSGELERKIVATTCAVRHPDRGKRGLRALGDTLRAVNARLVSERPIVKGPGFEEEVSALVRALAAEVALDDREEPPPHGLGWLRPTALVEEWVSALNRGDVDALLSFYTPDAVNHQVAEAPAEGREAIRKLFVEAFARGPLVCIIENLFADGDWAMLEWRDPKGLRGCGFFHVVKSQIVFQRGYWDKLSFLRQEGQEG
jgi:NAD(P)H-dependent FMN reductase